MLPQNLILRFDSMFTVVPDRDVSIPFNLRERGEGRNLRSITSGGAESTHAIQVKAPRMKREARYLKRLGKQSNCEVGLPEMGFWVVGSHLLGQITATQMLSGRGVPQQQKRENPFQFSSIIICPLPRFPFFISFHCK